MDNYKIENIVTAGNFVGYSKENKIDLIKIAAAHPSYEYNPERFSGVTIRLANIRGTMLLFSSGAFVVTGLRDIHTIDNVMDMFTDTLKNIKGIVVTKCHFKIVNIVAQTSIAKNIDLNALILKVDNAMYDPEVFPGAIYRLSNTDHPIKATFLLFSTGKIVCLGTTNESDLSTAIRYLTDLVNEHQLAFLTDIDERENEEMIFY